MKYVSKNLLMRFELLSSKMAAFTFSEKKQIFVLAFVIMSPLIQTLCNGECFLVLFQMFLLKLI